MGRLPVILLLSVIIASCGTISPMEKSTSVTGMDFRPFTERGFFMTPEKYAGDYEPKGLIYVTLWPHVLKAGEPGLPGTAYKRHSINRNWNIEELELEEALEEAYQVAIQMDADALVDMTAIPVSRRNGGIEVEGIEVSGFAIKRK